LGACHFSFYNFLTINSRPMKITKKEYKVLKGIIERYEAKKKPNTIAGVDFSEVVNCLHEVKVKPTIYDWSNEPEEVMFMCTDDDGKRERWSEKPEWSISGGSWLYAGNGHGSKGYMTYLTTYNSPFEGKAEDSLEARPQ